MVQAQDAGTPVQQVSEMAARIAEKSDQAEQEFQAAQAAYGRYQATKAELVELTRQFSVIASRVAAPAGEADPDEAKPSSHIVR